MNIPTTPIQSLDAANAATKALFDRERTGQIQGLSPAFLFSLPQRPLSLFARGLPDEISVYLLPGYALKLRLVAEEQYQATELQALHCLEQNPALLSLSALWLEQAERLTAQLAAAFRVEANRPLEPSPLAELVKILREFSQLQQAVQP